MSLTVMDFPYLPGKRLECLCGRRFTTERGLKQHIKRPAKAYEDGLEVAIRHGRCLTDAAKYMYKSLYHYAMMDVEATLKTYNVVKDLPTGTKGTKYTYVPHKL